ncbi:hypothetical protein ES703_23544 [subsurface metagenome]
MPMRGRLLAGYSRRRSGSMRGRLLRLAVIALAVLIAFALVWPFIAPAYNQLLIGASSKIVPQEVTLGVDGSDITVDVESQRPEMSAEASGNIESSSLHYGLLFLMALIAATPGLKLSRRAKFGAIALVSMFLIHLITMMVITRLMLSNVESSGSLAANPFMILFLTIGCDLFPLLVWGALSFRYWIPQHQTVAQTAT